MDDFLTAAEERLNLFAHMADSACGLSLWCFGMTKQLYTCTSAAEKEFRLFLNLGQCLDYAIAHGPESQTPILMSDPIGMLWVAECVWHGEDSFAKKYLDCSRPQCEDGCFTTYCWYNNGTISYDGFYYIPTIRGEGKSVIALKAVAE